MKPAPKPTMLKRQIFNGVDHADRQKLNEIFKGESAINITPGNLLLFFTNGIDNSGLDWVGLVFVLQRYEMLIGTHRMIELAGELMVAKRAMIEQSRQQDTELDQSIWQARHQRFALTDPIVKAQEKQRNDLWAKFYERHGRRKETLDMLRTSGQYTERELLKYECEHNKAEAIDRSDTWYAGEMFIHDGRDSIDNDPEIVRLTKLIKTLEMERSMLHMSMMVQMLTPILERMVPVAIEICAAYDALIKSENSRKRALAAHGPVIGQEYMIKVPHRWVKAIYQGVNESDMHIFTNDLGSASYDDWRHSVKIVTAF